MLNYEYPPLGGGAGNATRHLLREFARFDDLHITLVTSSTDKERTEKPHDNITIHFLDIAKKGSLHYQTSRDLIIYSWKAWRFCRSLMNEESFDIVHAFFGIPCGVIAYLLGKPYIISLRGSDVPGFNARFAILDTLLFARLSRFIWRRAKATIANSEHLKKLALQTSPGQAIEVIPNGVDSVRFHPNSEPRNGRGPLRVLAVGRLIPRKGFRVLIEAMRGLKDIELTIAGEGPQREELQRAAGGLNITFTGAIPPEEMPELYREHDIFVLPSMNEGMSNTVLEAMASGLPVVVTGAGGGVKELVKNGRNGYVVQPHAHDLRKALSTYSETPVERRRHGSDSRKQAETLSWTVTARQYIRHVQEALKA